MDDLRARIENDFTFHPATEEQARKYGIIRSVAKAYALDILRYTPFGREQSLALTKLEEVVFWANAAIARNE